MASASAEAVEGAGSGAPRSSGDRRPPDGLPVAPRRAWRGFPLAAVAATAALALSACGLHVSKHGVTGNFFGHQFSAASGQLPAGFPSAVPVPDASRVLGGGGADNRWDAGFAVTGSITAGTAAYQAKFQSAGYTLSNIRSGSTPATGAASGSTSTTITLTGSVFTATDAQWTVQVESGSTSAVNNGVLKAGEFAVNVTVVPTPSTAPPST
jgi:hypothetical protein